MRERARVADRLVPIVTTGGARRRQEDVPQGVGPLRPAAHGARGLAALSSARWWMGCETTGSPAPSSARVLSDPQLHKPFADHACFSCRGARDGTTRRDLGCAPRVAIPPHSLALLAMLRLLPRSPSAVGAADPGVEAVKGADRLPAPPARPRPSSSQRLAFTPRSATRPEEDPRPGGRAAGPRTCFPWTSVPKSPCKRAGLRAAR
jgi:hypothetical protein